MTGYGIAYRIGFTPWERYSAAAAGSTGALLDREEAGRSRPLGRALDLGCGRGLHTAELYSALTTRPPQRHEASGQADGNGFISAYDDRGQRVYRPGEGQRT